MTNRPEAKVILDSVSPEGYRMLTFQIKAHRFALAEINTHRKLSKNFRSSRAVPVKKLIQEVRDNPVMPVYWGKDQPGMQAREELSGDMKYMVEVGWRDAANYAADKAEFLARYGLHKQTANRLLEPFLWVHGVLSGTEFMNMFGLRLHEDALPEFQALAQAMWEAQKASTPVPLQPGDWHLPYVGQVTQGMNGKVIRQPDGQWLESQTSMTNLIKVSVARCARVSFKPFDSDQPSTVEQDVQFYKDKLHLPEAFSDNGPLVDPIHASPAEHQATPDEFVSARVGGSGFWRNPKAWGNLDGWRQYRKLLPGEAIAPLPKAYQ